MGRIELWLSSVLRGGVLLSALLVLLGGGWFLELHGQAPIPRGPEGIGTLGYGAQVTPGQGLSLGQPEGVISLGLLVLVLTPLVRVALSAALFLVERDWIFVLITLWVLVLLVASLLGFL
ncbi:DUF1634 domain-containing protein [Thermus albus]|uniref:DUF1634 domain-containing protein n=1 Tax=Thermus albus TaxID=2908146 RepID=UPI001FA9BDE0|nr:DUF1634 domain-containing protein [Thermus albus]